jgi:hypothetical protein
MTDAETTRLISDIIAKAQEGKAHPFRFILYWSEFKYYRRWIVSTKLIIKTLKASANKLFKEYCKDIIAGISDVMKLLTYSELLEIIAFYENDLKTVQQMLDDYDKYLGEGNFWYAFFGGRREL